MTDMDPIDFIHAQHWDDLPAPVRMRAKLCLLDLLGVAAGGLNTRLSGIVRAMAAEDMPGDAPILFDHRTASASGAAMAAGMTIDSLDGHDGYNPAKGHIGCPLVAALLAFAHRQSLSGAAFLAALAMGYEFGARAAEAQHATVPDYHTSGSWGAVTAAAAGARLAGFGRDLTRHALGIAEYHGPRSQMMRCIDHPSMLKDGSGWGAMAGVAAVQLARRGFTGAPAITIEEAPAFWADLGQRWAILEQYFKPYPVCRWAQAPVEGILLLRRAHGLTAADVDRIEVVTFHEAIRLATRRPRNTEEAQYSTAWPCAVALVRGALTPADIGDDAIGDPEILTQSERLRMVEHEFANAGFPSRRFARVRLVLKTGQAVETDWIEPRWDPGAPPTADELRRKYHDLADPVLGAERAGRIANIVDDLDVRPLSDLTTLLYQPSKLSTIAGRSA